MSTKVRTSMIPAPDPVSVDASPRPGPIPIKQIRFAGPQDGPGLSAASVVNGVARNARGVNGRVYHLDYLPWIRAFRITQVPPKGGGESKTVYIPEGRVAFWIPLDDDDSETASK